MLCECKLIQVFKSLHPHIWW